MLGFVDTHGRLPADPTLPQRLVAVLATATQISPAGHLAMAAAVKACVDEAGVQDGEPAELGAVDRGVRHLCQLRAGSGYARGGNQSCPTTRWDGTPESREPVTVARQTYGQVLEQVRGQVAGLLALVERLEQAARTVADQEQTAETRSSSSVAATALRGPPPRPASDPADDPSSRPDEGAGENCLHRWAG